MSKGGESPVNITRHLKGIDFPANKEDLIAHANSNNADEEVIKILKQIPDREYGTMADVMKGVGGVD